ncbi:methylated-DNA--protein-cysteine methyltransferase [Pseudoflavonifractor gallinarum]|uniref:Methylated-DNA--protein-cysteine methyltransferase n=1 Tax=Pseudoflavonifractor hominis TaxID=2763059 RepID=A0ABR7HRN2_9FIRM|nr:MULTISPECIES: methylated-DNA--[protein]-cysteine S-methyltransferase [Eubacteriales]MBC5730152.1 methylated-DNA--[protein]-cysteine S-methyltransferase [Pseudoflavonifractor hominis]MBS5135955.1 methylated-DNA--[protein]-cysteine S-methyltransferase [Oscillospiraceae bacterium]
MEFLVFDTPLGQMALAEESGALTRLFLPGEGIPRLVSRETPLLSKGRDEILAYLRGERRSFDLPLDPMGTPFQQAVWAELRRIPYGETRSYAQVAAGIGKPKAVRAVGQANHRNPLPIFIPCHRVIGASGKLTGYGGGLDLKEKLLELEGAR